MKPKLRVLHVITTIERGGAENQLMVLIKEQIRQGHEVSVLPLKGAQELAPQIRLIGASVRDELVGKKFLIQLIKSRSSYRELFDVVHAHLPRAEILASMIKGRHNFIVSRHNAEAFFPGSPKILSSGLSRLVTNRASHVVAISNAVMEFLTRQNELPHKVKRSIIYYGFPRKSQTVQNDDMKLRSDLNLSNDEFIIGTIARLTKQKNLETLLKSFKLVSAEVNAKLIIIGDGEERDSLENLSAELGISARVIWVGKTSNVNPYLGLMNVFCLTSLYEGFGLVLLEAMACDVPIVASNVSAIPEVLSPSHPGLAAPASPSEFAQRILKLNDAELRGQSIELGRLQLQSFNAEEMAKRIQNLYMS